MTTSFWNSADNARRCLRGPHAPAATADRNSYRRQRASSAPPFNQNTLPLIVPGPQVLSTSVPGGDSANGNLITDGTTSTLNVTFDRPMQVSTFTPSQVLQIMGPTGSISAARILPVDSSTGQIIPAATSATSPGTLDSTLTIPSYNGTFTVADITVELNAAFSPDSDLTAVLIAPDGTQVTCSRVWAAPARTSSTPSSTTRRRTRSPRARPRSRGRFSPRVRSRPWMARRST